MILRIVCFEDNPQHRVMLKQSFEHHEADIKFFNVEDWNITSDRAQAISKFNPNMAIVDLMDDATGDTTKGFRVIRKLKEMSETNRLPVIAWSVLFMDTPEGHRAVVRAEGFGAVPLKKSLEVPTPAERFLEAAHLI